MGEKEEEEEQGKMRMRSRSINATSGHSFYHALSAFQRGAGCCDEVERDLVTMSSSPLIICRSEAVCLIYPPRSCPGLAVRELDA